MFATSSLARASLSLLFTVLVGMFALAQPPKDRGQASDPANEPRKVKKESDNAFKRWLSEDVPYIISDAERKAFLALKTDEERENFISWFWNERDPDPETEENEFREAYYERIAYANEQFSSGIPGWRTDRGRIYIIWGRPDSVESRPSGSTYDRPAYQGGGAAVTYPFEIWFYRHLDGIGDGIEIEFVDPSGTGEYRIARDVDEKLVFPSGVENSTAENASTFSYRPVQDNPLTRQVRIAELDRPPTIKYRDLDRVLIDSPLIDEDALEFELGIAHFRLSDDRVITAFTVLAGNEQFKFEDIGGSQTARMNIFGRITAVSGKRSGIFEDSVTTNATAEELAKLRDKSSVYQKIVALSPGIYKVGVAIRDVATGRKGYVNLGFTVPRYDDKKLSTSSLILASKLRPTGDNDVGQMFVIGGAKVIPNLGGTYKQGQEVGIYLQVYNAQIDQTTLRPAVDVSYVILKDGKELLRQAEDWSGLSDSGQRLTLARLLPTYNVPLGDYEVKVEIKDRVSGQVIENKGKFTVTR